MITGLLEISLGLAHQCVRDSVLMSSFGLLSQWRWGMESHAEAKVLETMEEPRMVTWELRLLSRERGRDQ